MYAESVSGTVIGNSDDIGFMADSFSVFGLNDDQRQRVNKWIPGGGINEGKLNYNICNGWCLQNIGEESDSDDEDLETSLFKGRLKVAQEKLKRKEYVTAEAQLLGYFLIVSFVIEPINPVPLSTAKTFDLHTANLSAYCADTWVTCANTTTEVASSLDDIVSEQPCRIADSWASMY